MSVAQFIAWFFAQDALAVIGTLVGVAVGILILILWMRHLKGESS